MIQWGARIPNALEIAMVGSPLFVFQWCLDSKKTAAIFLKTIGNLNKMATILFGFPIVQFLNG